MTLFIFVVGMYKSGKKLNNEIKIGEFEGNNVSAYRKLPFDKLNKFLVCQMGLFASAFDLLGKFILIPV